MSLLGPRASPSESPWTQNSITNLEDGVRRVTVKQLLNAHRKVDEGEFFIDQQPLGKFIFVANVYFNRILLSKQMVTYGFDDGSGSINGYRLETAMATRYPTFAPFDYAVVVGQLKANDRTSTVKVLHIQPLYDPHEIYFHLLHVIFDTLRYERGNPRSEDWPCRDYQGENCPMEKVVLSLKNISLGTVDDAEKHQMAFIGNHDLSDLEEDIISCMKDLKEYMEAYDDERLSSGIAVALIVNELKPASPEMAALDLWLLKGC